MKRTNVRRSAFGMAVALVGGVAMVVVPARTASATPAKFTQVSAGSSHSCGLTPGGGVKCWGSNQFGELGNGTNTTSNVPVQVSGLTTGVISISAGSSYSCAVMSGAAVCWGYNRYGQLGNGSNTDSSVPVPVIGLASGVSAVSAGYDHSCAIASGAAVCWGGNLSGQLGNGTNINNTVAVPVRGLDSGVTVLSAGTSHSCAVVLGAAKCWGANGSGQLGNGTDTTSTVPVPVVGLSVGVTDISAGGGHSCAIVSGAAQCWGFGLFGQLGNGAGAASNVPVPVSGFTVGVTALSAGNGRSCGVVAGAAKCWGVSAIVFGYDTRPSNVPEQVLGLTSNVSAISAGGSHACGVAFGVAKCWGSNNLGQLGNASNANSYVPVSVADGVTTYGSVELVSTTSVKISWTDTSSNETGFLVYRVLDTVQTLVPGCSTTTANLTECTDTGLAPGTYYQYYVYAWNDDGATYPGTYLLTRTPSKAPVAPSITYAVATGSNTVTVGWNDNSIDETGFTVSLYLYRAYYVVVGNAGANATSLTVNNLEVDTAASQIFVVSAFNLSGETSSDTYVFTLPLASRSGPVVAPTYIGAANVTGTTATINWTDNATNELGYQVYRAEGSVLTAVAGCNISTPNLTTCTDTGLTPGRYLRYYVFAWNAGGIGDPGTGVIVHTPKPLPAPTITDATGNSLNSVVIHWIDNASDETSYAVFSFNSFGELTRIFDVAPNSSSAIVRGLYPKTLHAFIIATVRGTDITYPSYGIWATTTS